MAIVHQGQPSSRPSISGSTSAVSAAADRTTPPKSSRGRVAPRVSRNNGIAATKAPIATGRLMRKISRQPKPPRSGRDQSAAEQLSRDGGKTESDAINAQRPAALVRRKQRVDRGERLRRHRGRGERLQ